MKNNIILIINRSFLLRMGNAADKKCRENQGTYFMFIKYFFFENRVFYEITYKNIVQPDRSQTTI